MSENPELTNPGVGPSQIPPPDVSSLGQSDVVDTGRSDGHATVSNSMDQQQPAVELESQQPSLKDVIAETLRTELVRGAQQPVADRLMDEAAASRANFILGRGVVTPTLLDIKAKLVDSIGTSTGLYMNNTVAVVKQLTTKTGREGQEGEASAAPLANSFETLLPIDYCPTVTNRLSDMGGFAQLFQTLPRRVALEVEGDNLGVNIEVKYRFKTTDGYDYRIPLRREAIFVSSMVKNSISYPVSSQFGRVAFPVRLPQDLLSEISKPASALGVGRKLRTLAGGRDDNVLYNFYIRKAQLVEGGDNHTAFFVNAFRYYFASLSVQAYGATRTGQPMGRTRSLRYASVPDGNQWEAVFGSQDYQPVYTDTYDLDFVHFLSVCATKGTSMYPICAYHNDETYWTEYDALDLQWESELMVCGNRSFTAESIRTHKPTWVGNGPIILTYIQRYAGFHALNRQLGEAARIAMFLPSLVKQGLSPQLPEPIHIHDYFPAICEDPLTTNPIQGLTTWSAFRTLMSISLLVPTMEAALSLFGEALLYDRPTPEVTQDDLDVVSQWLTGPSENVSYSIAAVFQDMIGMDLRFMAVLRCFDNVNVLLQKSLLTKRPPLISWLTLKAIPSNTWAEWLLTGFEVPKDMGEAQFPSVSEMDIYGLNELGVFDGRRDLTGAFSEFPRYNSTKRSRFRYPGGNWAEFCALVGRKSQIMVDSLVLLNGTDKVVVDKPATLHAPIKPTFSTGPSQPNYSGLERELRQEKPINRDAKQPTHVERVKHVVAHMEKKPEPNTYAQAVKKQPAPLGEAVVAPVPKPKAQVEKKRTYSPKTLGNYLEDVKSFSTKLHQLCGPEPISRAMGKKDAQFFVLSEPETGLQILDQQPKQQDFLCRTHSGRFGFLDALEEYGKRTNTTLLSDLSPYRVLFGEGGKGMCLPEIVFLVGKLKMGIMVKLFEKKRSIMLSQKGVHPTFVARLRFNLEQGNWQAIVPFEKKEKKPASSSSGGIKLTDLIPKELYEKKGSDSKASKVEEQKPNKEVKPVDKPTKQTSKPEYLGPNVYKKNAGPTKKVGNSILKPWMPKRSKLYSKSGWRTMVNNKIQKGEAVVPKGHYLYTKGKSNVSTLMTEEAEILALDYLERCGYLNAKVVDTDPTKVPDYQFLDYKITRYITDWFQNMEDAGSVVSASRPEEETKSVISAAASLAPSASASAIVPSIRHYPDRYGAFLPQTVLNRFNTTLSELEDDGVAANNAGLIDVFESDAAVYLEGTMHPKITERDAQGRMVRRLHLTMADQQPKKPKGACVHKIYNETFDFAADGSVHGRGAAVTLSQNLGLSSSEVGGHSDPGNIFTDEAWGESYAANFLRYRSKK